MANTTLHHPPFPPLNWRDDGWESNITLAAWSGYSRRFSPECPRYAKSDGFNFVIRTKPTPATPCPIPTSAQTVAFDFLLKSQHAVQSAILEALLPYYNERRPDYKAFLGRDFKLLIPKATNIAVFRELISPGTIFLHPAEKAGMAYTGFLFSTCWEVEHGLGFILHGGRVVEIGDAETAFSSRIAE